MALQAQTANNYLHIADQDRSRWQVAKISDHLVSTICIKLTRIPKTKKNYKFRKATKKQSHDCRSQ